MSVSTRAGSVRGGNDALQRWYGRHRADILLVVIAVLVTGPVMQTYMAQQASRYTLTAAIWDDHSVALDGYTHALGVDRAHKDGRVYSDKPPGQPLLAVPAYAAFRALGGEPAMQLRVQRNLGLWFVSLWSSAIPFAALLVLMRRSALQVAPDRATLGALALGFGTLLLPFATVLFAHVLAALIGMAAYHLIQRVPYRRSFQFAAGLLAGIGVTVEYTMGVVGAVLFALALWRTRRLAAWFIAGAVGPASLLAAYHWAVFGGPFAFSYRYSEFTEHLSGLGGVQAPSVQLLRVLFGDRGLFILTPIVLVGIVGLAWLVRERADKRPEALAALSMVVLFIMLQGGWSNPTGGASPGARYVVPALPFLAIGVAYAWKRVPRVATGAFAIGALTMGLATFTAPLAPKYGNGPAYWFAHARDGDFTDTIFTAAWGAWTLVPPLLVAVAVGVRLLRSRGATPAAEQAPEVTAAT